MAVRTAEPVWVPEKRKAKAERILAVLRGFTPDQIAHLDDEDRRAIEDEAGVKPASTQTWTLVVEMLAGSARPLAACPTCLLGDPEGVPVPPQPFNHDGPCSDGSVGRRT